MLFRFNLALAFFVPPAFENITWRTYIIFGVFCFVMVPHIFLTYPETSGKTLEEIDTIFDNNVAPWRSAKAGGHLDARIAELAEDPKASVVECDRVASK